jgi:hypothetical protein
MEVTTGITGIIGAGIDAVLGNVAANESEQTTYAISCGALGGVMRIDINIFCYSYTAEALTKVTNNVMMVAYTISSVDASKLDADTLRNIVQTCYGGTIDDVSGRAYLEYPLTSGAHSGN